MTSFGDTNPRTGSGRSRYPGTFLLAVREALAQLNWQAVAWKSFLVECLDGQGRPQQVGLENIYRRVRREPRETWPNLLVELLGSVPAEIANPPKHLNEVAEQLLVRIGQPFHDQNAETDVWSQPLVERQLAATLVIDYPSSMTYVTKQMIADSGQSGEDWLRRGLDNLRARSKPSGIQLVHEDSGLLQAQFGDAYDSSRALLLDELLPGRDEFGFFVIVPGRDHLLILPISEHTVRLAPWLRAIAAKTFREMPYPISPELYWVRQSVWHHFEVVVNGDDVFVRPPAEFMEVAALLQVFDEEDDEDQNGTEPPNDDEDSLPF
jgi:hypothetical protein